MIDPNLYSTIASALESTLSDQATWMRYSLTSDGAGGSSDGWLAAADPATGQPTIPCRITQDKPVLDAIIGGEVGEADAYYRGAVPLRIPLGVRDRLVLASSGLTYEVLEVYSAPDLRISTAFGCRQVTL